MATVKVKITRNSYKYVSKPTVKQTKTPKPKRK
jgi:hypothetical protein